MMHNPSHKRLHRPAWLLAALVVACSNDEVVAPGGRLAAGTWGGEDAGVIVDDSTAHVHIGCTLGDFRIAGAVDGSGRLRANGSYVLRAFPIQLGPPLPAEFIGSVTGNTLVLQVTVTDTVENRIVIKGPVSVTLGRQPELGACPICRRPEPAQ